MGWGLNLDGFSQGRRVMESHFLTNRYESSSGLENSEIFYTTLTDTWSIDEDNVLKKKSAFQRHVVSRVAIPIQLGFVWLDMFITQTLRGLLLSGGGVLTLDLRKIIVGLTDLLSVAAQTIALPIIALLAFFDPLTAIKITDHIEKQIGQDPRSHLRDLPLVPLLRDSCFDKTFGVAVGIISVPLMIVRPLIRCPIEILSLEFTDALCCIAMAIKEPLMQISRIFRIHHDGVRTRLLFAYSGNYLEGASSVLVKVRAVQTRRTIPSWY